MIRSILLTTLFSIVLIASSQDAIATGALVFDLVAVEGTQDFSITASGSSDTSTNGFVFSQTNVGIMNGDSGHLFVNGTPSSIFSPNPVPNFQFLSSYVSGDITLALDTGPSHSFTGTGSVIGVAVRGFKSDFAMALPVFDEQGSTTTASGSIQLALDPSMDTTDAFFQTGTYATTSFNNVDYVLNISTVPGVPEPSTIALLSLASMGVFGTRRR